MRLNSIILFVFYLQSCSANLHLETDGQISMDSILVNDSVSTADFNSSNNIVDKNIEFPLIGEFTLSEKYLFNNTKSLKEYIKKSTGKTSSDCVDLRFIKDEIYFISKDTINLKIFNNVEADANGVDGGVNYLLVYIPTISKLFIYSMDDFSISRELLTLHIRIRDKISNENFYYNSSKHIFEKKNVHSTEF